MKYFLNRLTVMGFVLVLSLFLNTNLVSAQTAPSGSISNSPACTGFPCNTTVSWNTTDPAGNGVTAFASTDQSCGIISSNLGTGTSGNAPLSASSMMYLCLFASSSQVILPAPQLSTAPAPTQAPATPTPYPNYRLCNAACGNNNECAPGLACISGLCRLPSNPSSTSCAAPSYSSSSSSAPTATPTPRPAGSVLGTSYQQPATSNQTTPTPDVLGSSTKSATPTVIKDFVNPTPSMAQGVWNQLSSNPVLGAGVGIVAALVLGFLGYKLITSSSFKNYFKD